MASELPPPAYDEVVNNPPIHTQFSRQDSIPKEAKRRLIQDVVGLKEQALSFLPGVRKLSSKLETACSKITTHRSKLEREMKDRKAYLIRLVEEAYNEEMNKLQTELQTSEHKLVLEREKTIELFHTTRQLCYHSDNLIRSRNHYALLMLKRNLEKKVDEIGTLNMEENKTFTELKYVKLAVSLDTIQNLVGKFQQEGINGNFTDVQNQSEAASLNNNTTQGNEINAANTRSNEPNNQEISDPLINRISSTEGSSNESTVEGSDLLDNQNHRTEEGATAAVAEPPQYKLVHSIQTKTFNDRARCHPYSFAVDIDGNLIVPDKFNKIVKVFTHTGQLIREITHPSILGPTHVTLTLNGDIVVSDSEAADVKFFSPHGQFLQKFPKMTNVSGLVFNLVGDLIVTDTGQRAVHILDPEYGKIKSTIRYYTAEVEVPLYSYAPGFGFTKEEQKFNHFQCPHYVTIGCNDEILVTDRAAGNYKVLDARGNYLKTVGKQGREAGMFNDPYGICNYMGQSILVADYSNHIIQKTNMDGDFLEPMFGRDYELQFPTYVTYTADEKLMVSEYLSGKVKIFSKHANELDEEEPLPPAYTDVVSSFYPTIQGNTETEDVYRQAGYGSNFDPYYNQEQEEFSTPFERRPPLLTQQSWETSI